MPIKCQCLEKVKVMNRTLSKWIIILIVQCSIAILIYLLWGVLEIFFYGHSNPSGVDTFIFLLMWIPWNDYIRDWINKVVRDYE